MDTPTTQNKNSLPPDEAKASLGVVSRLMQQAMPKAPQDTTPAQDPSQGAPTNQQNATDVKAEITGLESRIMDELQTLRAEMKDQGDGKKELADLKAQIEQILNE